MGYLGSIKKPNVSRRQPICWFQFLLCVLRRDAGGTADFFLSQPVAFGVGIEFGHRRNPAFANLMHPHLVAHTDGQDAPGNQSEQPPPGGFAAIGATAAGCDLVQGDPFGIIHLG